MIAAFFRTVIIYLLLLVAMRILGKRQVGELQLTELATMLMLSELAVLPISDTDTPVAYAFFPILTLLCLEVFLSFFASRSVGLRRLIYGAPSLLIYGGRLNEAELRKLRIGLGELLSELRLKDAASISEVQCAILEDNGKLSVFRRADVSPLTAGDAGISPREAGVSLPVIVSGKLIRDGMRCAGIDAAWVDGVLARRHLRREDVILRSVDEVRRAVLLLRGADGKLREVDLS